MGIHFNDLQTASLIQEKHSITLADCARSLGRSVSSIKRSISAANEYLPPNKEILIENNCAVFQMSYQAYMDFIQSLSLDDYIPSQDERLDIMAVYGFLNPAINLSRLYDSLHISMSTKKKDSRALSQWLREQGLMTQVIPKTGISITGSEIRFRMCVCNILHNYIEVDRDFNLTLRKANNPWQSMIAEYYIVKAQEDIRQAKSLLQHLTGTFHYRISYTSVKFLYIYVSCSYFRLNAGHLVEVPASLPVTVTAHHLLEHPQEDDFLDQLISSLDFTTRVLPPDDEQLLSISLEMIRRVQEQILTWISDDHNVPEDVFAYLHKCIIRNAYHFSFYDNKLEETRQQYNNLYDVVRKASIPFEQSYGITLSHFQTSTLTLIFRKYINRNKLRGRNQKRLVIVTNSSVEKVGFFMEKLKLQVDVLLAGVININEIYLVEQMEYDYLIVFSNRIASMLAELDYPCLKLHFYLTKDDIELLFSLGFSTSKRKIKTAYFIEEIQNMDKEQLKQYLLQEYDDFFLE